MSDEQGFLDRLLIAPQDDAVRLVYADWLEERGDEVSNCKSEFLRVCCEWSKFAGNKRRKDPLTYRLMELAAKLDRTWFAIVGKMPIENCDEAFRFQCPKNWENLNATQDTAVRFCEECRKNVYYCNDIEEAHDHATAGECVAVNLGIIRRDNDLDRPRRMLMGKLAPDYFRRRIEEERAEAEREYGRTIRSRRK